MTLKRAFFILYSLSSGICCFAQEDYFVGFTSLMQKKNPSYLGYNNLNKVGVLYNTINLNNNRQVDNKYFFGTLSFDELKFSLGVDVNSFQYAQNGLTNNLFNLTYIYKIQLKPNLYLLPALSTGFANSSLETENLIFGDQLDALQGFVNTETLDPLSNLQGSINYFDLSASFLLHSTTFMMGLAFQHLNRPNRSFNKENPQNLPILYKFMGAYELDLNPFQNNLLPQNSFLFLFAAIDIHSNRKQLFTAQEMQLGPFSIGINQKLNYLNRITFNNFGFMMGVAVENFDFGLFYQLPIKGENINPPSIFELQVGFNFSKFRRNNKGLYKRLQTDNYFGVR